METNYAVSIKRQDGCVWVVVPDALGIDDCRALHDEIESKLSSEKENVVIDFCETNVIYSAGIGFLIRMRKSLTEKGCALYLVNMSKKLRLFFNSLNLDRVFDIYATDIEFYMSKDEIWRKKLAEEEKDFIFVAQIEQGIYRLTFSGHMSASHDLSPLSEFDPDTAIEYFILNLESLDIIDTYGAQLFNDFIQRILNNNGKCIAFGASELFYDLTTLFPSHKQITFYKTEQEALKFIAGK